MYLIIHSKTKFTKYCPNCLSNSNWYINNINNIDYINYNCRCGYIFDINKLKGFKYFEFIENLHCY